jgi:hypothetical protein
VDYETLADLRYHIRRFIRVREDAARAAGVEPQHYVVLLQIKGFERRQPATIGALTERLQIRHHATVQWSTGWPSAAWCGDGGPRAIGAGSSSS